MKNVYSWSVVMTIILALVAGCINDSRISGGYSFSTVDVPTAVGTVVNGINSKGDIVGVYIDRNKEVHGFLRRKDQYTTLNFPSATATFVASINDLGSIVGDYTDTEGVQHGFLLVENKFSTIDFPGAVATYITGINNFNHIVGIYLDAEQTYHGFLVVNNRFSSIDVADALKTVVYGITDTGVLAGGFQPPEVIFPRPTRRPKEGFTAPYTPEGRLGKLSLINWPQKSDKTEITAFGVDKSGRVIGQYIESDPDAPRGFIYIQDQFYHFDYPGAVVTGPTGINSNGQIVGFYDDSRGNRHGFLASPQIRSLVSHEETSSEGKAEQTTKRK